MVFGMLIAIGSKTGGILQDYSTFLAYVLSAGGTLLVVMRFKKIKHPDENTFYNQKFSTSTFLISVALILAVIIATEPLTNLIPMPEIFKKMLNEMFSKTFPAFLTAVIAAPILEEMIFRGIILEGLLKNYNPFKAIIITNLLFGIAHMNPWQFVGAFIIGIFISWIYMKTRSIILPILMHFINNLTSYLLIYFTSELPTDITLKNLLGSNTLYITLILLSILIIVLFVVYQKKLIPSTSGQNVHQNQ
jgi:hypothetical protein